MKTLPLVEVEATVEVEGEFEGEFEVEVLSFLIISGME